jgi:hypothetical protein
MRLPSSLFGGTGRPAGSSIAIPHRIMIAQRRQRNLSTLPVFALCADVLLEHDIE